jgi:splicing factor 3A subunit 3
LNGKKHKKAVQEMSQCASTLQTNGSTPNGASSDSEKRELIQKNIPLLESLIVKIADFLSKQRDDTKANIERKQALTYKERVRHLQ